MSMVLFVSPTVRFPALRIDPGYPRIAEARKFRGVDPDGPPQLHEGDISTLNESVDGPKSYAESFCGSLTGNQVRGEFCNWG